MDQHYFSESPAGEFVPREIEVELAGAPRRLVTAGGVFSPEHLDQGTRVLLRTLAGLQESGESHGNHGQALDTASTDAPILDIGCGWGPIALDTALRDPGSEIWAVDVNARARELTTANASRLGLTNVRVAAPDEVPAELRFGSIRSNPPIRVGKAVLHGLLRQWLPRLAPGGSAHLVVAKHLGADSLQRWIAAELPELTVTRVARDKGFHVIEARRG
ncbi:class I SAM-dependent methyltransferase [Leucobacter soli]|uniref:Ribosomal RNA small subunit methyltransferase C n=1 Tax=Leucobacter soli TaxID=2812850 RepID=A0A916JRS0_9MICO|nr:methyltransferase [Leucobacter soli]CAG7597968.1 Ribosomal RNA small subunit methyltransferase C [Leucobacter soli]